MEAWISAHCQSVAPAASKFAPNRFRFSSKAVVPNCSRTSSSRISILICRFIFGGRANFANRWTRNFGRGSIA